MSTQENSSPQETAPTSFPLTVNLQYTKDLSFEVPHGAATFATLLTPPQVGVDIDVQVAPLDQEKPVFEVSLKLRAEAIDQGENAETKGRKVFIAELTYAAIVSLENAPQEIVEPLLLVEVPRLLFPYARAIISDITREGGFPPIVLQPIDFVALWQAKRAQQTNFPETQGDA